MAKEENEQQFEIAVTGPGVAIKLPADAAVAHRVISLLMGGPVGMPHTPGLATGHAAGAGPAGGDGSVKPSRTNPREALNEAQAKRSFDKITAIGAMLMDSGAENFTTDDMRVQFKRASEALPQNLNRDMRSAVKTGWIAVDDDSAGTFYVTQAGRDAIAKKFTGDARKTVGKDKSKAKKKKAAE